VLLLLTSLLLLGGGLVLLWGWLLILWLGRGGCYQLRRSLLLWESDTRRILLLGWGGGFLESGHQSREMHEHVEAYIIPAIPIVPWWRLLQDRLLLFEGKCRGNGYPCTWRSLSLLMTVRARISARERLLWLRLLIPIPILRRALLARR